MLGFRASSLHVMLALGVVVIVVVVVVFFLFFFFRFTQVLQYQDEFTARLLVGRVAHRIVSSYSLP